ncbi:MAG: hypothetical protein ACJKTH_03385 [Patescibacteria group bacterium UBA2163]
MSHEGTHDETEIPEDLSDLGISEDDIADLNESKRRNFFSLAKALMHTFWQVLKIKGGAESPTARRDTEETLSRFIETQISDKPIQNILMRVLHLLTLNAFKDSGGLTEVDSKKE